MNPSTSKITSSGGTTLPNNRNSNNPTAYNPQGYNTFDRSVPHVMTLRVGDITPFYAVPEIEGNNAKLQTFHHLRSRTINSALFSRIRLDKSFYQVPWSAIQPNTWKILYRQPIGSQDITFTNICQGIRIDSLSRWLNSRLSSVYDCTATLSLDQLFPGTLTACLLLSLFYSNSSLFKYLGISVPNEDLGDEYIKHLTRVFTTPFIGGTIYFTDYSGIKHSYNLPEPVDGVSSEEIDSISKGKLSEFFSFCDDVRFYASSGVYLKYTLPTDYSGLTSRVGTAEGKRAFAEAFPILDSFLLWMKNNPLEAYTTPGSTYKAEQDFISFHLPIAYQLICAQYYSNSNVDEVYSAHDYLDNIRSLCFDVSYTHLAHPFKEVARTLQNSGNNRFVLLDGVSYPLDAFAGQSVHSLISNYTLSPSENPYRQEMQFDVLTSYFCYFSCVMGINRSLREGDYFTSGRVNPLATGDVSVDVVNNSVSVWDVNKSLWIQRFRNAVNRLPQSIYEYIRGLTGVSPERIESQPNVIVTEHYGVSGYQIENTASEQGKLVTLLNDSQDKYHYEAYVDEPSYIIGVYSFVYENIYPKATTKIAYMTDRLDWFNHFLQHGGDEAVMSKELSNYYMRYNNNPISYQIRYSAFKYGIPRASGAFSSGLLKNTVILRNDELTSSVRSESDTTSLINSISPSFIRNNNVDIEPLFTSLTGENFTDRYHFEVYNYFTDFVNSRQAKFPGLDE